MAALLFSGIAFADGGIMPATPYEIVFAPDQKAVIFWDGSTETMILSTKITSENFTDFAWVVPIQSSSKPEVKQADNKIFFELADLFYEGRLEYGVQAIPGLSGAVNEKGVKIVQTQKVDIYDLTILKATDADSLLGWLNDNNFYFPEDKEDVLEYYIQSGNYYFVANKINLLNKYPDATVGENEKNCAEKIYVDPYYYAETDVKLEEYFDSQIEYEFGQNIDCNGANLDGVRALVNLREGIATPLEFVFKPAVPFYPMAVSSVNKGDTTVDVYVFGNSCFEDSSKLLEFKNSVEISADMEYDFMKDFPQTKCISLLHYYGPNSSLVKDSFFSEKAYSPEYDPNYEPPMDFTSAVLLLFFILIPIACLLLVGTFAFWLLSHFFKFKKTDFKTAMICSVIIFGGFIAVDIVLTVLSLNIFEDAVIGFLATNLISAGAALIFGTYIVNKFYNENLRRSVLAVFLAESATFIGFTALIILFVIALSNF